MAGKSWLMWSAFDGTFAIDASTATITAYVSCLPLRQDCLDVLLRRVLPRLTTLLSDSTPIHAAGISDGQSGALLIGASGAGKSTLAAASAHLAGWSIYSDDITILQNDGTPMLTPCTVGVCIWPTTREGLGLNAAMCSEMDGYDGKVHYKQGDVRAENEVPLRRVIFIERQERAGAAELIPLPPASALAEVVSQLIHFNPGAPLPGESAILTLRFKRILRTVPAYRLRYKAGYANLASTLSLLRTAPP
jgi:hypothetical protein